MNGSQIVAQTAIEIAAPASVVWQIMIDVDAYPEWNPFVVEVRRGPGPLGIGGRLRLRVRWHDGGGATSSEHITVFAPPTAGRAELAYRFTGWLDRLGLVHALRSQTLQTTPTGTRYETRECFTGALARLVPLARVQAGFERHAAALRRRAEALSGR